MHGNSAPVTSNQSRPHEDLPEVVRLHLNSTWRRPVPQHTLRAFETVESRLCCLGHRPLILDSGCGTGESSRFLARTHPDHVVIGIDKSESRLRRARTSEYENLLIARADLFDFWRLISAAGWQVSEHYLLYPNPWPKKKDLRKRLHCHPVFKNLVSLSPFLEVRSNWKLYLQEFSLALHLLTGGRRAPVRVYLPDAPITPFERKYLNSGHTLYRLQYRANGPETVA